MYSCSVLWKFFTSALVPAGTLDTLSALNAPRCPKASQGLTRSLWAEMVFPDVGSQKAEAALAGFSAGNDVNR